MMIVNLKKGTYKVEKIDAWYSLCSVEILVGETPLRGTLKAKWRPENFE